MKSCGVCIGATTLSVVEAEAGENGRIEARCLATRPHHGNPRAAFLKLLEEFPLDGMTRIAVTGRKLREGVNLSTIPEPEAVEEALAHLNGRGKNPDVVISAGGENVLVYVLGKDGKICAVKSGNKCASGTGEFYVQQLRRIGMSLDEAEPVARKEIPYRVSGRCSVFCKSDCTHAANKGIPKGRIAAGLCEMIAGKISEILSQTPDRDRGMIIGGLAQNKLVIDYLSEKIKEITTPAEAPYFEALGAALWALKNPTLALPDPKELFKTTGDSFSYHVPLSSYENLVEFKELDRGVARAGDCCLLGLDVGSTTTKAVVVRKRDDLILASVYLRTNGNPVEASRACFAALADQLSTLAEQIDIVGVGVTGSGRQIAGLYAMTEGVINEIIAHAAGALFFDAHVDTIFEIGGQDAKYTHLTKGVPSDYAMNDACSAGTGSFLEEAARETMGVEMEEIGPLALLGEKPPNFNDQCAAFISSDIKHAFQDGLTREDILAGLVYSICMNYTNRVKGARPVGETVFMQGGVCYNRAVPLAMAALTGKRIVVPPEPGLIGAFGVALEIKRRLDMGVMPEKSYSLLELKDRAFERRQPFICKGGQNGCDRKCEIARVHVEGKTYPFGGACNRWYNFRTRLKVDTEKLDLVREYERRLFSHPEGEMIAEKNLPTLGINKSFYTNTFLPLYRSFFERLGFRVLLPDAQDGDGAGYKGAAFCYPAEIAHCYFLNLLQKKPDYLFLPHVKSFDGNREVAGTTCPLTQGEPYYLATAYKDHETMISLQRQERVLRPVLNFSRGKEETVGILAKTMKPLGVSRKRARQAYEDAWLEQEKLSAALKEQCQSILEELEKDPERQAIVLVGRTYNAYVSEANKGISQKIASRGLSVLPHAYLPLDGEDSHPGMYWEAGQTIMKSVSYISRHPQLFPCYITNFSCGPDSFLLEYFRHAMGRKPLLILELDSHVADAGLETRIEAFLDIIANYRELRRRENDVLPPAGAVSFTPAGFDQERSEFHDSRGGRYAMRDPRINVLIPSLSSTGNRAYAAVFRSAGIRATALPPADEDTLRLGRGYASCKECLPLILTLGSLLKYLKEERHKDELLLYFMPTASGPCRFGQYSIYIRHLLDKLCVEDVALFSLQAENSYENFGGREFTLKLWSATLLSDLFQEIYSLLLTNAVDRAAALHIYESEWTKITTALELTPDFISLKNCLKETAHVLRGIEGRRPWAEVPVILLAGEIYVRHDDLSRQFLVEKLADQGWATKTSGVMEWIYYTDYCFSNNLATCRPLWYKKPAIFLKSQWMKRYEIAYRRILSESGVIPFRQENVPQVIENARDLISPELTGEAILTVGGVISDVPRHYSGAIALGPFGCMPNRLAEAILSREMGRGWQLRPGRRSGVPQEVLKDISELPFLAIESDGNPFPQVIAAKMEVFLSQAARLERARKAD